jgi:hypothetical protein
MKRRCGGRQTVPDASQQLGLKSLIFNSASSSKALADKKWPCPKHTHQAMYSYKLCPVESDDWPNNAAKGFICGTIPCNDAPCITYTSSSSRAAGGYNINQYAPSTFASCCNGPIIKITQPITDPADPSFGATYLAYCPVDFSRTLSFDGGFAVDY